MAENKNKIKTPTQELISELYPGVDHETHDPPYYLNNYPCFKRVQLAAVKHGIFHPDPPRITRLERDDTLGKLSDEHSRTTTCLTARDFEFARLYAFPPADKRIHCLDITETGRQLRKMYFDCNEILKAKRLWEDQIRLVKPYLGQGYNKINQRLDELSGLDRDKSLKWKWDGVAVRQVRPEKLSNWRYSFKDGPRLMPKRTQQPNPALDLAKYRPGVP